MEAKIPKPTLIDFLTFPLFLLAFLGVLCIFDVVQRIAYWMGYRTLEKAVALLNKSLVSCLRILRTRIKVVGLNNYPLGARDRPYIIVSNHQSMFDISVIHSIFSNLRPKFVAKKQLSKWIPSISYCLRNEGSALIDRENGKQAISEIIKFGRRMKRENFAAVIFPEGTRARDANLKPFKTAGLMALTRTVPNAVIIPIALDGSWKLAARPFGPIPCGVQLTVNIGAPVDRTKVPDDELGSFLHQQISQLLSEIRS